MRFFFFFPVISKSVVFVSVSYQKAHIYSKTEDVVKGIFFLRKLGVTENRCYSEVTVNQCDMTVLWLCFLNRALICLQDIHSIYSWGEVKLLSLMSISRKFVISRLRVIMPGQLYFHYFKTMFNVVIIQVCNHLSFLLWLSSHICIYLLTSTGETAYNCDLLD